MKKINIFIITIIIQTLVFTLNASAFYNDVPKTNEYHQSIKALYDQGLLPAETNNKFHPNEYINKKDFLKILLTYGNADLSKNISLPYTDEDNNSSYAAYLQTALDLGIIKTYGISPKLEDKAITKHYALNTLFKTLGIGTNYFFDKSDFYFKDLDPNSDIAPIAHKSFEIGITEKDNPHAFKMAKRITKGELVNYLYKINQYSPAERKITITTPSTITPTTNNSNYSETEEELLNSEEFETFLDVWTKLHEDYYYHEELNNYDLIMGAITGMVSQTSDLYTVFHEPVDASSFMELISSEYEGIGMYIEMIDENITIISPLKNSPAEKAGLKPNDIILEVNGESMIEQTIQYTVTKIKGPADTTVKIKILRDKQELTFTVTREAIQLKTAEYTLLKENNKKIGYIALTSFSENTDEEFYDALSLGLEDKVDGWIIDLRNNPGGLMNVSINILSAFTEKGSTAVSLEYANGGKFNYVTSEEKYISNKNIAILINDGSASAAEIMAGALQDLNVATIIGVTSFGKGSVQDLVQYNDGSIFKYTISTWLTPNGNKVNGIGITPDIVLENNETEDLQLNKAINEITN